MTQRVDTPSTSSLAERMRALRTRTGARLLSAEELAERGRHEVRHLMAARRAAAERRFAQQLADGGIPERMRSKGFAEYAVTTPAQRRALRACRRYVQQFDAAGQPGAALLLLGASGTGKTHLACATLIALMRAGHSGRFSAVSAALRLLRDAGGHRSHCSEGEAFALLSEPDLLVLDDLGGALDETQRALLFEVFDTRYANRRATIVTASLSAKTLAKVLGERSMYRLGAGDATVIECAWQGYGHARAGLPGEG